MEAFIIGALLMVGAIVLVIGSYTDGDIPIINILFTILMGFFGILQLSIARDRGTHSTIEINASGIKHNVKGTLVKEMTWGPDVTVDVRMNNGRRNDTHGPLAGFTIHEEDNGSIEFDPRDGWPMEGIRKAWEPLIGLVREKELRLGEELVKYLECRSKEGLDNSIVPNSHEV